MRNPLILLLFGLFLAPFSKAQVDAYFSSGKFNTPQNEPYLETYLTIIGKSLATKSVDGSLQNSVNIEVKIFRDSALVKAKKYNLHGPLFPANAKAPSFIDAQRYALPNGRYNIEVSLSDSYEPAKKPLVIKTTQVIDFNNKDLQASSIQPLESFNKSVTNGPLTKCGYDLVPYPAVFYPESNKELAFYFEAYNTAAVLGESRPFVFSYYLEHNGDLSRLENYGAFKKQQTAQVNPLLAKMDITSLPSGNYNLVIELRDASNMLHVQQKFLFQRLNGAADKMEMRKNLERQTTVDFVGNCNDLDTLKMFVECLWPIADNIDKERVINHSLDKDPEMMKRFVVDFWQRRAADTTDPIKLWANYYKQVQSVMTLFKCGKQKGYYTDRGRVYLQYGPPSQRSIQNNEQNTFPYEIWQYYRTTDNSTGMFFSNRRFVFVNKMIGDDCHKLIHSDMRGEINNPQWQFELTRRNNNGISNPDNGTPAGTQFNQFNDIYSNPR